MEYEYYYIGNYEMACRVSHLLQEELIERTPDEILDKIHADLVRTPARWLRKAKELSFHQAVGIVLENMLEVDAVFRALARDMADSEQ